MSETNELHVPLFTNDNFHYVPWLGETDNHILRLHYDSISFTPPLNFANNTLQSLDKTFNLLDGQFATQMTSLRHRIFQLHSVHTTHFNDYLTYIVFALALVNTLIISLPTVVVFVRNLANLFEIFLNGVRNVLLCVHAHRL